MYFHFIEHCNLFIFANIIHFVMENNLRLNLEVNLSLEFVFGKENMTRLDSICGKNVNETRQQCSLMDDGLRTFVMVRRWLHHWLNEDIGI